MVVINGRILEAQEKRNTKERKHKDIRYLFVFKVYFRVVFNLVLFSVLGADEVFTGQRHADAVYERSEVGDDGTTSYRGEGKAITIGCTDRSRELTLRK